MGSPPFWYYEKTWNEADVAPSDIDVWNLHGYMWGLTPENIQTYVDRTPDCRYSTHIWLHVGSDT